MGNMNINDLKDVLQMRLDSEKRKAEELTEKSIVRFITSSFEVEGVIIIDCNFDKETIEHRLNKVRRHIRGCVINQLKSKLSPDGYIRCNEYLNHITDESITGLQDLYDSRHRMDDLREILGELFGGGDDED